MGLHTDTKLWHQESVSNLEHRQRLWWSLYDLDVWLAFHLGRPHSIDDIVCSVGVPSESVLCTICSHLGTLLMPHQDLTQVPHNPPGYSGLHVYLSRLLARCTATLRLWPTNREQSHNEMRSYITQLENWWSNLPSYFKTSTSSPPTYARALSYLYLRYLHVVMIITRSSLLQNDHNSNDTKTENDLTTTCVAANERSLALLHEMRQKNLISRVNFQDTHHILSTGIVLVVRNLLCPCERHVSDLIRMRPLLLLTDHITIGRSATESVSKFLACTDAAHVPGM